MFTEKFFLEMLACFSCKISSVEISDAPLLLAEVSSGDFISSSSSVGTMTGSQVRASTFGCARREVLGSAGSSTTVSVVGFGVDVASGLSFLVVGAKL